MALSILASSFFALSSNSIYQTKFAFHIRQGVAFGQASLMSGKPLFRQIEVFQIVQMLQDGFTDIECLRPSRRTGQCGQPFLNLRRQLHRQHDHPPSQMTHHNIWR